MGDLMRPAPRRSPFEHILAVARWVGIGRILAIAGSVLAVAAGSFWLLRAPESANSGRAAPAAGVAAPTMPPGPAADPPAGEPCTEGAGDSCATTTVAASTTVPAASVVHVAGAVQVPGVYTLPAGSRVGEAITAAGGAAADAALDAVNLAAPVTDGQQVYVPRSGEASGPAPAVGASTPGAAPGPVDLNAATEEELLALPGVGPVLAAAIVRHREEAGPFASVDGLLDVSGIGPARLDSLRDLVRV